MPLAALILSIALTPPPSSVELRIEDVVAQSTATSTLLEQYSCTFSGTEYGGAVTRDNPSRWSGTLSERDHFMTASLTTRTMATTDLPSQIVTYKLIGRPNTTILDPGYPSSGIQEYQNSDGTLGAEEKGARNRVLYRAPFPVRSIMSGDGNSSLAKLFGRHDVGRWTLDTSQLQSTGLVALRRYISEDGKAFPKQVFTLDSRIGFCVVANTAFDVDGRKSFETTVSYTPTSQFGSLPAIPVKVVRQGPKYYHEITISDWTNVGPTDRSTQTTALLTEGRDLFVMEPSGAKSKYVFRHGQLLPADAAVNTASKGGTEESSGEPYADGLTRSSMLMILAFVCAAALCIGWLIKCRHGAAARSP